MTARNLEQSANRAIQTLRRTKHKLGLPFMIHSDILESNQCFLEYPDGSIKLVEANPKECDFIIILEYNMQDSKKIIKRFFNL
jgi:hypothetical protein